MPEEKQFCEIFPFKKRFTLTRSLASVNSAVPILRPDSARNSKTFNRWVWKKIKWSCEGELELSQVMLKTWNSAVSSVFFAKPSLRTAPPSSNWAQVCKF